MSCDKASTDSIGINISTNEAKGYVPSVNSGTYKVITINGHRYIYGCTSLFKGGGPYMVHEASCEMEDIKRVLQSQGL